MSRKFGKSNSQRRKIQKLLKNGWGCGCFICTGSLNSKFKNKEYLNRSYLDKQLKDYMRYVT
jgi:hypothetical protein